MKNTKLSALFEDLRDDYDGRGVNELLSDKTLSWDRLDENDVQL